MKIITWNCNMAFRKKAVTILQHKPDLLIVQECEHPGKITFAGELAPPTDILWFGKNVNKGLAIFSYSGFRLKLHRSHNEDLQLVVPIKISKGPISFMLYAIWANNPGDPDGQYVTQVWKALHHYGRHISKKNTILIGDFNSNTIWDRPRREGNHSTVVQHLAKKSIHSVYHKHFSQEHGREVHPTLYMYRHKDKPYHIDYCFASSDFIERLTSVEIGDFESWRKYSDHVPIIITFEPKVIENIEG
jgi:exodeoxyribonuclease III